MRTSQSGESALLLLDVVNLLRQERVEYAVVGALAASVHGAVRASMDADVVLSIGMPGAKALEDSFRAAGFLTELTFGGPMDLIDAARAISAGGDSLDLGLVRRLAKRYGSDAAASLDRLLTR